MISFLIENKASDIFLLALKPSGFTDKMLFMFLRNAATPVLQYLFKYLIDYTQQRYRSITIFTSDLEPDLKIKMPLAIFKVSGKILTGDCNL